MVLTIRIIIKLSLIAYILDYHKNPYCLLTIFDNKHNNSLHIRISDTQPCLILVRLLWHEIGNWGILKTAVWSNSYLAHFKIIKLLIL